MLNSAMLRTAALVIALALSVSANAMADSPKPVNVPAGDLTTALELLEKQSGVEIVYRPELLRGVHTSGVKGTLSSEDAVTRLLKGTKLKLHSDHTGVLLITEIGADGSAALTSGDKVSVKPQDQPTSGDGLHLAQVDQGKAASDSSVEKQDTQASDKKSAQLEEVIVTGTHIRGSEPVSPLIVLDRTAIEDQGISTIADALQSLSEDFGGGKNPLVLAARGSQNSNNVGYASSPDLRGLGASSTLTLLNGYRMASSGFGGGVDISTIPLSAIDRVEVLTDGASAVYGSDAIGGVVNVILRKNYSGFEAREEVGDSTRGGGLNQRYNLLGGSDWSGGSAFVDFEHSAQNPIYSSEREFASLAQNPTALVPDTKNNSLLLSMTQDVSTSVSGSLVGFYNERATNQPYGDFGIIYGTDSTVYQTGATAALHFNLPREWTVTPAGTYGRELDHLFQNYVEIANQASLYQFLDEYKNTLSAGQIDASGPLFSLPAGSIELATGAGYRKRTYEDDGSEPSAGVVSAPIKGSQGTSFGYVELALPLISPAMIRGQRLDLNLAGRYERYNTFGGNTSPEIGLRYRPADGWTLKGTWGKSFKAPEIDQQVVPSSGYFGYFNDPSSSTGKTGVLLVTNGLTTLGPERAETWSGSLEFKPVAVPGLAVSANYYEIDYRDRIAYPIPNLATLLTEPGNAPFVTRNPSLGEVTSVFDALQDFYVLGGGTYNPSNVGAIGNAAYHNVSGTEVRGVDFSSTYPVNTSIGILTFGITLSWLDMTQTAVSTSPEEQLSGTVFNPPRWKSRAAAAWSRDGWNVSAYLNYIGSELDNSQVPYAHVSSWTTADAQISYRFATRGLLRGARIQLVGTNLFDRDPPHLSPSSTLETGIGYDSTNASPVGRFVKLQFIESIGKSGN